MNFFISKNDFEKKIWKFFDIFENSFRGLKIFLCKLQRKIFKTLKEFFHNFWKWKIFGEKIVDEKNPKNYFFFKNQK